MLKKASEVTRLYSFPPANARIILEGIVNKISRVVLVKTDMESAATNSLTDQW